MPPLAAKKVSQSKVEWGSTRNDSYAWLQDKTRSNPEVLSYLEQVSLVPPNPYICCSPLCKVLMCSAVTLSHG